MNIAEEYFNNLSKSKEFQKAYIEEAVKFDLELKLNLLKEDIKLNKSQNLVFKRIKSMEKIIQNDLKVSFLS
jgi:hypothetical protein